MLLLFIVLALLISVFHVESASYNNNQCGFSTNTRFYDGSDQTRIIGGKMSNPADWPFIVRTKLCTATIIGDRWVMSAAHCPALETVNIRGREYEADAVINHENYNPETNVNDIQLIKLEQPIQFTRDVSNVCLFRNVSVQNGIMYTLHHKNDMDFRENSELHEVPLAIRNLDFCSRAPEETINKICAGGEMSGTSEGDSGGPLLVVRNNRWVQIGITSDGTYKPVPNSVSTIIDRGMYTQVSAFCGWIEMKTSGEVRCQ